MVVIANSAKFCFRGIMVEIWYPVDREERINCPLTWSKELVEQLSILSGIIPPPGQGYTGEEMDICRENDLHEEMDICQEDDLHEAMEVDIDEPSHVELKITEINRNSGIAKCYLGSVYLSDDILRSLISLVEERQEEWYDGEILSVGHRFTAWISYNRTVPMETDRILYEGCPWRCNRETSSPW